MKVLFAVITALFLATMAYAYPPLTVEDVTQTSITLGNLDCNTRYEVRVRERRNNQWRDASTITRTTAACTPPPIAAPTANFSFSPANPQTGQQVSLNGSASTCPATPCTYVYEDDGPDGPGGEQWPLGTGQSINFTFQQPGTKNVRLTVTDAQSRTATVMNPITVTQNNPPPTDTDGDGVPDSSDACPTVFGTLPNGCPDTTPPPTGDYVNFPNRQTTGVPNGWTPTTTRNTSLTVTQPGTVIENVLFTNGADLIIQNAANVTVRNVRFEGGTLTNQPGQHPCSNGLLIENSEFVPPPGQNTVNDTEGAISYGGYTARNVEIWHRGEGFRASGSTFNCGPIVVENSFALITPPSPCGDWHGDGIQGYGGTGMTVRNTTLILEDANGTCYGTAPIFYPHNQNESPSGSVVVDGLLVEGGGAPFRVTTPGPPNWSAVGVRVVNNSWVFFPIDSPCEGLSPFEAAAVEVDSNYKVTSVVRPLFC